MGDFQINAKVKLNTKNVQSQLDKIKVKDIDVSKSTKSVKTLGQTFADTTKKVTQFYTSVSAINLVQNAFQSAMGTVKQFDDTLTDFKKVSDLSGQSLINYTKTLGDLGSEVARTREEMVASATLFKQSGYSDEDTKILAQVAELYRNVADAQISSATSSGFITSQLKAFNIEAKDAITIIDQVNEVSNNFAVSSSDIAEGLTKSSASLSTYGNSLNETIALVSAGTEIMTNQASRVSRGLVSIGANIVNLANDAGKLEYEVGNTVKSIRLFDDATGEMKDTYQVLSEVSDGWDEMSRAQQSALALSLAGKTQISVFTSILGNFNSAVEANETALGAQGSAMKENDRYMESMSAKLNQLKSTFQEIILGDGGLESFAKTLLDVVNGIASFLKETKGLQVMLTALTVLIGVKLLGNFKELASRLITNVGLFREAKASGLSFGDSLKSVGISASTANIALTALTAIISIGTMTWNYYKAEQEEAIRVAEEAKAKRLETVSTLKDEIATMTMARTSLQNEKLTRSELSYIVDNNLISYSDEISKIGNVNTARQTAIDKIDEEIKIRAERLKMTGESDYRSALKEQEATALSIKGYEEIITNTKKWIAVRDESDEDFQAHIDALVEYETHLTELYERQSEATTTVENFNDALGILGEKYDENSGEIVKMNEAEIEAYNTQKELSDATGVSASSYEELANSLGMTTDELQYYADTLDITMGAAYNLLSSQADLEEKIQDLNESYSESLDNLSGMEGAYRTLAESANEYNKTGEFSLDTLDNLLSLGDEYLALLEYEDGQFSVNKTGLENLANARIDDAEATLHQKAMAELAKLANNDLSDAIDNASTSANNSVTANNTAIGGVNDAITACLNGKVAWNDYWSAVSQTAISSGASKEEADKIGDAYNASLLALEKARGSIGSYAKEVDKEIIANNKSTKAKKKSTKASKEKTTALDKEIEAIKKHIKALKDEQSALKDSVGDYEDVISYIIDSTEKKISQLETKRDKALNKILIQAEKIAGTYEKEVTGVKAVIKELKERYETERAEIQQTRQEAIENYYAEYGAIYDQIEALKQKKAYEEKIAEFEARKKAVTDYYETQISYLEDQGEQENKVNAELERQITLQEKLEALARAKSQKVKVFKDGKFVYQSNEDSVASASKDLADTKAQQKSDRDAEARQERIAELKKAQEEALAEIERAQQAYEDSFIESYDSQIAKLQEQLAEKERIYSKEINDLDNQTKALDEQYKKQKKQLEDLDKQYTKTKKTYNDQINSMKDYIKNFEKMVSQYEENQIKLLTKQLTGIDTEKKNWETRLTNLNQFVDSYNAKLKQLASLDEAISNAEKNQDSLEDKKSSKKTSGKTGTGTGTLTALGTVKNKATGESSVPSDGLYRLGEDKHAEIAVGSKLNGELMNLSKGDGVINAKATNKFAGYLNSLADRVPSNMGGMLTQTNSTSSNSITFGNIILPNADGTNFMSELNNSLKQFGVQIIGER